MLLDISNIEDSWAENQKADCSGSGGVSKKREGVAGFAVLLLSIDLGVEFAGREVMRPFRPTLSRIQPG